MKRFNALMLILLTVGVSISLAAMPKEKNVVKIEVSQSAIQSTIGDAITVQFFDLAYVAEASGEQISDFQPPTVIGKTNSAYLTSIDKPPTITVKKYFSYSKRC